jgi:hypothetical protein
MRSELVEFLGAQQVKSLASIVSKLSRDATLHQASVRFRTRRRVVAPHVDYLDFRNRLSFDFSTGVCGWRRHMPGNLHQCRLNAARCLALARRARRPEPQEAFALAAETEADDALLRAVSNMEFGEPSEALPLALGLLPRAA